MVEKKVVLEQIEVLFQKYYQDLNKKNFFKIKSYFPTFVNHTEYKQDFLQRNTVFYNPQIIGMAIIGFASEESIFRVQINATTISFTISKNGYILQGNPTIEQYSKYWEIILTDNNQFLIKDIYDTLATKILVQDNIAKQEAFRDAR